MELETLTVVMAVVGLTLLYGAVTNRNPVDVVKLAVTGQDISKAAPLSTAGRNLTAGPGAIPGEALPGTPQGGDDARTDPPGFDPRTDDVLPRLPGEGVPPRGTV